MAPLHPAAGRGVGKCTRRCGATLAGAGVSSFADRREQLSRQHTDDDFVREVNASILELGERFGLGEELLELVCECGDACCHEHLAVPAADYERLIQQGECLVVAPGHEHGRAVGRGDGYVVCDA